VRRLAWIGIVMAGFGGALGALGRLNPTLLASINLVSLLLIAALFLGLLIAPRLQRWKSRDSA